MYKEAFKKIIKPNTTKPLLPSNLLYIKLQRKHISSLQFQLILHEFHQVYTCKQKSNFMFAVKYSAKLFIWHGFPVLRHQLYKLPSPPSCPQLPGVTHYIVPHEITHLQLELDSSIGSAHSCKSFYYIQWASFCSSLQPNN